MMLVPNQFEFSQSVGFKSFTIQRETSCNLRDSTLHVLSTIERKLGGFGKTPRADPLILHSSSGDCRRKSDGAARSASREGRPWSRPGCVDKNLTLGYAIALVSALTRELSTEPLVKQLADRTILTRQRSCGYWFSFIREYWQTLTLFSFSPWL